MKVHKTSKLFYRVYPYKIELSVKGAEYVKRHGLDRIIQYCGGINTPFFFKNRNLTDNQKEKLIEFATVVTPILNQGHKIRVEMNTISIYLNDENVYAALVDELKPFIKSVTIPDSDDDLEKLFSKNHIVVCNRLPHGKYEYKLMLKTNLTDTVKQNLVNWLETSDDACRVPKKTKFWLHGYRTWIHDPFMYVKSSKHLTMLGLILGSSVKSTHEYVLRDAQINSVSEENLCQP